MWLGVMMMDFPRMPYDYIQLIYTIKLHLTKSDWLVIILSNAIRSGEDCGIGAVDL